jgi:predicted GIY-YIG superfamily endonuclease
MRLMASAVQPCAAWGCEKAATYDKPLCYPHWLEWDAGGLEECASCHGFDFVVAFDTTEHPDDMDPMCDDCFGSVRGAPGPPRRPIAHAGLARAERYIYILKLEGGSFYVGQTTNLPIRMQEHADGTTQSTRGKAGRLVYYETHEGGKTIVAEREKELTLMANDGAGRRSIRVLIEEFRKNLRLLHLEA